jgi:hypothetical protein
VENKINSNKKAFQDYYPDELSHCYGCGRLNDHGLQIKSYWDGDEASAAATREAGLDLSSDSALRFVTASLQVDYLRPTPMGIPLEVRGVIEEIEGRKVVVGATVSANGEVCARGRVVTVQMPEHLAPKKE